MSTAQVRLVAAYAPFATFLSAIEALDSGFEVPHRLDKLDASVWPSYSVAIRSQLMGAFRFLGLIDSDGKTTAAFKALVRDKPNRALHMKKIILSSYTPIVALDLTKISPRQLDSAMREYGLNGTTHKKAISFFLGAARFAGIPISPLLQRKIRERVTRGHSRTNTGQVTAQESTDISFERTSKTIPLRSGGSVTLIVESSFFDMETRDRRFISDLIDKLQEYERAIPGSATSSQR